MTLIMSAVYHFSYTTVTLGELCVLHNNYFDISKKIG